MLKNHAYGEKRKRKQTKKDLSKRFGTRHRLVESRTLSGLCALLMNYSSRYGRIVCFRTRTNHDEARQFLDTKLLFRRDLNVYLSIFFLCISSITLWHDGQEQVLAFEQAPLIFREISCILMLWVNRRDFSSLESLACASFVDRGFWSVLYVC